MIHIYIYNTRLEENLRENGEKKNNFRTYMREEMATAVGRRTSEILIQKTPNPSLDYDLSRFNVVGCMGELGFCKKLEKKEKKP